MGGCEQQAPVLVIGVGSELRRDDAAGRRVAEQVAARRPPGVEVRSIHQLTPELAVDLSGRQLVLIVDAAVGTDQLVVRPLLVGANADGGTGVMTHHLDPAALVALAMLFGEPPRQVVLIGVPAHDTSIGTDLSSRTRDGVELAVTEVLARCADVTPAIGCGPAGHSE